MDLYEEEGKVPGPGIFLSCSERVIDKHLTIEITASNGAKVTR